jgi:ATP-dependent DNA helicase MPH1
MNGPDLSDMEGEPSSEPNTSPQMRMRSQAVSLGSEDTSGSDVEDGYVDTDLEDFVVDDDQPLSQVDSSLPSPSKITTQPRTRPFQQSNLSTIESSQELPDLDSLIGKSEATGNAQAKQVSTILEESGEDEQPRVAVSRRRRIVSDDDDD